LGSTDAQYETEGSKAFSLHTLDVLPMEELHLMLKKPLRLSGQGLGLVCVCSIQLRGSLLCGWSSYRKQGTVNGGSWATAVYCSHSSAAPDKEHGLTLLSYEHIPPSTKPNDSPFLLSEVINSSTIPLFNRA